MTTRAEDGYTTAPVEDSPARLLREPALTQEQRRPHQRVGGDDRRVLVDLVLAQDFVGQQQVVEVARRDRVGFPGRVAFAPHHIRSDCPVP